MPLDVAGTAQDAAVRDLISSSLVQTPGNDMIGVPLAGIGPALLALALVPMKDLSSPLQVFHIVRVGTPFVEKLFVLHEIDVPQIVTIRQAKSSLSITCQSTH